MEGGEGEGAAKVTPNSSMQITFPHLVTQAAGGKNKCYGLDKGGISAKVRGECRFRVEVRVRVG